MSEHGVHLAYFDNQDNIQILNPGFELGVVLSKCHLNMKMDTFL